MDTNAVVMATSEEAAPWMENVQTMGLEYGAKILGALIVLIVGFWLAKMIRKGIVKLMEWLSGMHFRISSCSNGRW